MAWNLHLIVECEGQRKVLGYTFGRGGFDAFLGVMVVVHAGFVVDAVMGWSRAVGLVGENLVLLAIFGVAWVATWRAEEGGLSLA